MTDFGAQLVVLSTIAVSLALLMVREYVRVFEVDGHRHWPRPLGIATWLLLGVVALFLLGRFVQLMGGSTG